MVLKNGSQFSKCRAEGIVCSLYKLLSSKRVLFCFKFCNETLFPIPACNIFWSDWCFVSRVTAAKSMGAKHLFLSGSSKLPVQTYSMRCILVIRVPVRHTSRNSDFKWDHFCCWLLSTNIPRVLYRDSHCFHSIVKRNFNRYENREKYSRITPNASVAKYC